jgi:inorganic triphosphatase YgiF
METELKLSLSEPDLHRLLAHPLLAGAGSTQRLLNTYFDTPDLALQQRRMAVRERLAGDQWLLTVKTAGQSDNGLSRRQEWEGPTTPGALAFDALVSDTPLAAELMAMRPRWVIAHADAQIEVALDQGRIHVPGTDLTEPLLELELELLSGPESALMALADVLRQTPLGTVLLTPSDASKAQRGMSLWAMARTSATG